MRFCYVVGDPIAHSLSPNIHSHFLKTAQIAGVAIKEFKYERQHILSSQINGFENFVHAFFNQKSALGLNITLPFKFRAFDLANSASIAAQLAHSANTLSLAEDSLIYAHNTDGIGLVNDLIAKKINLKSKNILIIGAGGATFGVLYALIESGVEHIYIANRSVEKAQHLLTAYQQRLLTFDVQKKLDLPRLPQIQIMALNNINNLNGQTSIDLLINATSLGLLKNNASNDINHKHIKEHQMEDQSQNQTGETTLKNSLEKLTTDFFSPDAQIYEMSYGLPQTFFYALAQRLHLPYHQGFGMLIEQAKASFMHWQAFDHQQTQDFNDALFKAPFLMGTN